MPLNELEFEYNGVIFGGTTQYAVTQIEGLDPTDAREEEVQKAIDHGSYVYSEFLDKRRIIFAGYVNAGTPTALETAMAPFKAAFRNQLTAQPLKLKLPGQVQKRVYCQPRRRSWPTTLDYTLGFGEWTVELTAGDPRIYDDVESIRTGSGAAVNDGDFSTFPTVTITGAATNPTITNTTTGESLRVNTVMGVGDNLVIDFLEKTIMLNGTSIYGSLDSAVSDFFDLEPGSNAITYSGGGVMEMRWRSAWY